MKCCPYTTVLVCAKFDHDLTDMEEILANLYNSIVVWNLIIIIIASGTNTMTALVKIGFNPL